MAKLDGNLKVSYVPSGSLAQFVPPVTLGVCLVTLMFVIFMPVVFGNKERVVIQSSNNEIIVAPQKQEKPIEVTRARKIVGIREISD